MIAESIMARLRSEGYVAARAADGPAAVATFREFGPDLVVLDVMLPGFDGLEVCRRIRAIRPVPVLMLTARDAETDVVIGLGVGVGDYLAKPFGMRELVARVQALLRRTDRPAGCGGTTRWGALEIDAVERRVRLGSAEIHLTRTEFDILAALAANPRAVLTRESLLAKVRGWPEGTAGRVVDSHIKALRRKLGEVCDHQLIPTVHGIGYALEPADRP
jgi:DNA-binding response OmpR family regulator